MAAIEKFARIFAITVPAFLPREKPISRNAKPACMNMTRQPATITQVELMPTVSGSLPAPAASNVSASAEPGSTSAASTASALMRTALLLATAPRDRLFMGVSLLLRHAARRTWISVTATVSARRRRVFIPVSKIWAARSDSWSSGALQSGVAHARSEALARRQHRPRRAAHSAAVRVVPDGQAQRELRDGDLEVAVRLARRRRARSQELELGD